MKLKKKLLIATFWTSIFGAGCSFMVLAGFYLYLSPQLPSVESIKEIKLETPLRVYTADHKLIGEFGEKRRKPIKYEQIPQDFINALISAEDSDFYSHNGVSLRGLMRAVTHLILTGRKGPGGSTLTMQLTRHIFLSLKQTFSRKFNEILLALRIEKELSKEQILELYVNKMFLGQRAHGIEAAAEVYYGSTISDLSLAQHAMLVGVFKGPSVQNPITNPERALTRRNYVLGRMLKQGYISQEQHDEAISEPVTAKYHGHNKEVDAPYVAEMARLKALELFGKSAYSDGYRIYTTVRSDLQQRAQESVVSGLLQYDERHGYRGPEQQLEISDVRLPSEAADDASQDVKEETDLKNWLETLEEIPAYGGLIPAVVMQVSEQSLTLLLKTGEQAELSWEQGLSSARPYLTEDARGPSPEKASDVASIGDVIRLTKDKEDKWRLAQIPAAQASLVSLSPHNGAIIALTGGFDFYYSNFNRAVQAQRQPGSNFKPFIYTAALEHGLTPATIINDAPIEFYDKQLENVWRPDNSSGKFDGPTRLREALYRSKNLVSIRVLERIGISNAIDSLEKFGFDSEELPHDLSLVLGSHAVTPLEVATGYTIFANGGYRVEPFLVERILDTEDEVVYEALPYVVCKECENEQNKTTAQKSDPSLETSPEADSNVTELANTEVQEEDEPYELHEDIFSLNFKTKSILGLLELQDYPKAPKIMNDQVAYIIDSMLRDVVKRGTGYKAWAKFKRPDLAGKTGTSNGPLDVWFSGYHPNIVTSTWVGFDQNLPLGRREFGTTAALPIWIDYMELALVDQPVVNRVQPSGVVSVRIDPETGLRAKVGDPDAVFEIFRVENVPDEGQLEEVDPWKTEETINEELF